MSHKLDEPARSPMSSVKVHALATAHRVPDVIRNPFFMMTLWITLSSALYALGWSKLFSPFRGDTAILLIATSVIFLVLAFRIDGRKSDDPSARLNIWTLAVITVYFVVASVANGGIPVLQVLSGSGYDIYSFGIDGLHIFMTCLTGYYGVRAFRRFLDEKRKLDLLAFAWILVLLVAIGSRSAASFLIFACVIIYFRSRRLRWFIWIGLLVLALVLAYVFGVYGDYRLSNQIAEANGTEGDLDAVLQLTGANDTFAQTGLSHSWLWAFSYFVSPLANLNQSFAYADGNFCGVTCNIAGLSLFEWVPDVVGPRIAGVFGIEAFDNAAFLIRPDLTASTAFGSAVAYAGFLGALSVVALIGLVGWVTLRLLKGSAVREEGIAILSTLIFFSFFENMIVYTALLGQLVFVITRTVLAGTRVPQRLNVAASFL